MSIFVTEIKKDNHCIICMKDILASNGGIDVSHMIDDGKKNPTFFCFTLCEQCAVYLSEQIQKYIRV